MRGLEEDEKQQQDLQDEATDLVDSLKPRNKRANNPVVAVIDDDSVIHSLVSRSIERLGYRCLCFDRADTFLKEYDNYQILLLFLDIKLPLMTGIDLLKKIRGQRKNFPVVVITGYAQKEIIQEMAKYNVACFLVKPFTTEAIEKEAKKYLETKGK